jgi:hypothetical protein
MSRFDTLYADVKKFYDDTLNGQLTVESVTILTRYTMEAVQLNSKGLKGSEKKALVLDVVNQLVKDALEESDLPDDTKQAIMTSLALAPILVDAAVDFAKIYNNGKGCKICCFQ